MVSIPTVPHGQPHFQDAAARRDESRFFLNIKDLSNPNTQVDIPLVVLVYKLLDIVDTTALDTHYNMHSIPSYAISLSLPAHKHVSKPALALSSSAPDTLAAHSTIIASHNTLSIHFTSQYSAHYQKQNWFHQPSQHCAWLKHLIPHQAGIVLSMLARKSTNQSHRKLNQLVQLYLRSSTSSETSKETHLQTFQSCHHIQSTSLPLAAMTKPALISSKRTTLTASSQPKNENSCTIL
jgi:hypothetical protein